MPDINRLIDNLTIPKDVELIHLDSIGKIDIDYHVNSQQICFTNNFDHRIYYEYCFSCINQDVKVSFCNVPSSIFCGDERSFSPGLTIFTSCHGNLDEQYNIVGNNDKMILHDCTFYFEDEKNPDSIHCYALDMNNQNISNYDERMDHKINCNRILSSFVETHLDRYSVCSGFLNMSSNPLKA